jgi:hypothetical protein
MERLTDEQLAEISKRAEAATPGDWCIYDDIDATGERAFYLETETEIIGDTRKSSDAEFIAHAREDVPKLLAEIERLRSESNYWRMEHDHQRKLSETYSEKYKRAKGWLNNGD